MSVTHGMLLKRSENQGTLQNWVGASLRIPHLDSHYSVVGVDRHQRKR